MLLGRQDLAPGRLGNVAAVLPPADVEVGGEEREEPEPGEKLLVALEPGTDQDAGLVRIGNHLLHDAIAAVAVGVADAHTEGVVRERLQASL